MTIATDVSRNDYIGTGLVDTYPYTFKVFDETDLLLTKELDEVFTTLVLNVDYTVTGIGNAAGGNIVLSANLEDQANLTIRRIVDVVQETDIRNQGTYFPDVLENALDYLTMIDLQQEDAISRSIKLPETEAGTIALTTLPSDRASKFLFFDANKHLSAVAAADLELVAVSPFMETLLAAVDALSARQTLQMEHARTGLINGYLDWNVPGDNTLTCAIKTLAGTNPSPANPVFVWTHPNGLQDEPPQLITMTSAANLSIVVPQGALLGAIANQPLRIWATLAITAAGVPHLALVNCLEITSSVFFDDYRIRELRPGFEQITTISIGTGADLAGVFYATTGVAGCQYVVLGHATWNAGLATAGVWNASTSTKRLWMQGHPLPGDRFNSVIVSSGGTATGTATIPLDDTVPAPTEGDQYASVTHTGASRANLLEIGAHGVFSHSASPAQLIGFIVLTLGGADQTIAVGLGGRSASADALCAIDVQRTMFVPFDTDTVNTFSFRAGASSAGTTRKNGAAGARLFGGGLISWLKITEIQT